MGVRFYEEGGAMSTRLAWHNAFQQKGRAVATIAGITFSVLLMFMQFGFLNTARRIHTLPFEILDFDLMMTSDTFESLQDPRDFPIVRMFQAKSRPGVSDVSALNIGIVEWTNPVTEIEKNCMFIGLDLNASFISNEHIRTNIGLIKNNNTVMIDQMSHQDFGEIGINMPGKINDVDIQVAELFLLGRDFKSDGKVIGNNATFYSLRQQDPGRIALGMIKVQPGQDIQQVKMALTEFLPLDVLVFDREELIQEEQDYFTKVKPIDLFFQVGVLVAFTVGSVILFQVLATDIAARFHEFATLKAMGLENKFIYLVGFQQALIYGISGYIPAMLIASGIFYVIYSLIRIPISMGFMLAGLVLILTFTMCSISILLVLRKVKQADPADLF